jgi:hypothetical protein
LEKGEMKRKERNPLKGFGVMKTSKVKLLQIAAPSFTTNYNYLQWDSDTNFLFFNKDVPR